MEKYSLLCQLSGKFFKQLPAGAVVLKFAVQLVDVVAHGDQDQLGKNLLVAAQEKLPETVILLDGAKSAHGLYGAVHAQQDALLAGDALQGLSALLDELFGDLQLAHAL